LGYTSNNLEWVNSSGGSSISGVGDVNSIVMFDDINNVPIYRDSRNFVHVNPNSLSGTSY
jgi:hypothetical protein